jgi:DNA polymerase-3 subunit beta
MKLTILAGKLKVALGVAKIAASTRSTYGPIFEHILLDADGDLLTLSGTDAEARSWHAVSADINEAGAVALPPKALADFLDVISDGEPVVLTADDRHKAELVSGRTRVRIAGLDPELFPPCPDFGDPLADLTLGADELVGLIGSVAHAAVLTGDSRPELAGILIRAKEHALTLCAADGYRLAYRSIPFDGPDLDVIAHARYLLRIAGELKRATSARLLVDANRSQLCIDSEAGSFAVRLIEGQYPDFNRIIPHETPIQVTADRDDLLRAARLIRNVVTEEVGEKGRTNKTQRARLTVRADEIEVRASGTDGDQEAEVVIPSERERGDDLTITFNGAYFRDAVEAIDSPRVTIELVDIGKPAIVRPAGARNGHLQVIMPMHIARSKQAGAPS